MGRQLEKRGGAHHKSARSPRPVEEPEPEVPVCNSEGGMMPTQFRQDEMAPVRNR